MNSSRAPTTTALAASRRTLLLAFLALGLAWCLGLFGRNYWTPDEPREAALAASVAAVAAPLPSLAGQLFAEKPPLSYWLAGASQRLLGASPAATRLPQLGLALLALFAVMALARAAVGNTAAWVAGLLFACSELTYQVQVWIDTDALLLAGVCMALAGMYAGLGAADWRARLRGYLVMHAGLTLAFFGKNLAAWLVPVLAFLAFVAWERRWRELLRWEFWLGALLPLACISAWVLAVARMSGGEAALRVLFWNNLVGRAVPLDAAAPVAYATGHRNWPGKYFVELLLYLLPWTPLVAYALARAWRRSRDPAAQRAAWRFALCAAFPGLVVLSLAATARGIYAAPCMPGFALLAVLAWREDAAARGLEVALRCCAMLVGALTLLLLALTLLLARTPAGASGFIVGVSLAGGLLAFWIARRAQLPRLLLAWCLALGLAAWAPFVALNRTQDLGALAARVARHAGGHPVYLWQPDETTEAWAQLYLLPGSWHVLDPAMVQGERPPALLARALAAAPDAQLLAQAPQGGWNGARWRAWLADGALPEAPPATAPAALEPTLAAAGLVPRALLERPGGRGYLLWTVMPKLPAAP
jgi:4-amino-4-deoxy-L-arabinose transferase